jgi:hypothetical protein
LPRDENEATIFGMMRWNPWIGLAALSVAACESKTGNDDGGVEGFQLIDAEFGPQGADEFTTLILTFSDPVAPVDGVVPTDFRISMGVSMSYMDGEQLVEQSAYYEPATWVGYYEPVEMSAIANGPGENQITLSFETAIGYVICTSVENHVNSGSPGFMVEGGLFPHYAPGSTPVANTEGEPLAAIGPEWVLTGPDQPYYYGYELFIEEAGFPNLVPQIPIPCMP